MTTLDFIVAIPARFASVRLPGKPLRLIGDEPMVVHVARRALAAGAREVVVATDDERIAAAVAGFPVTVCMTRADHASGTDRLAECAKRLGWDAGQIVVNLQGDEPFAPAEGIQAVVTALRGSTAEMATLATPFEDVDTLFDPNAVKVIRDAQGLALYFSRAPVPWHRDRMSRDRVSPLPTPAFRHIGIYSYRAGFLRRLSDLPPTLLERAEALEQLRVLESGYRIAVGLSPVPFPAGVDTEDDLRRACEHWQAMLRAPD